MLWIITCDATPNKEAAREKAASAHRAYMTAQKGILILAGATRSDDGETIHGSLFALHVKSRAEAKAFSDGDPYTQAGVFSNIKITRMTRGQWNPASAEGAENPR